MIVLLLFRLKQAALEPQLLRFGEATRGGPSDYSLRFFMGIWDHLGF
jgi:hypothetical protein